MKANHSSKSLMCKMLYNLRAGNKWQSILVIRCFSLWCSGSFDGIIKPFPCDLDCRSIDCYLYSWSNRLWWWYRQIINSNLCWQNVPTIDSQIMHAKCVLAYNTSTFGLTKHKTKHRHNKADMNLAIISRGKLQKKKTLTFVHDTHSCQFLL